MVWVRSEYAGELAVLFAWLSALIPWNVTASNVAGGRLLFVRFPFFQVRYASGIPLADAISVSDPLSARAFQAGQSIEVAYTAWVVGAAVLGLAVLLSLALYVADERLEESFVDPVRAMGALLAASAVLLAVATWLLWTRGFPGVPVPLGIGFQLVFGGVLLTVERT